VSHHASNEGDGFETDSILSSMLHDDGQHLEGLEEADVVLVWPALRA
jgi:regulator of PEP synthase PpsR (kinase-PPPase family)